MIQVETIQNRVATVAERWLKTYGPSYADAAYKGDWREKHADLCALPPTATAADVAAVIGNYSWTNIECHVCGAERLDLAVAVGQEPDYDANFVVACLPCLRKAVEAGEAQS